MKHKNLINFSYKSPILKKIEGDTTYLIDEQTGVLFSQSKRGIITFQNIEGDKWLYTEVEISLEKDLLHFTTITESGDFIINGIFKISEDKEALLQKAYNYFSAFIIEDNPFIKIENWNIPLN
ncbi:MAG TPA: hypothetical protein VF677_10935 [Flavobacterium sp.]|jgi:hypothetical protein